MMETVYVAVELKTPDPEAVTALNTIRAMRLQLPPIKLFRCDFWRFDVSTGGTETVSELLNHYRDIVNPNKQFWSFVTPGSFLSGEDSDLVWVKVAIRNREDITGSNWSEIVKRGGFPVDSVQFGVLWRFGYLHGTDDSLAEKMAMDLSVSHTRSGGLLGNPVSQEVSLWI